MVAIRHAVCAAALIVTGCASNGGMPGMQSARSILPGQSQEQPEAAPETFAYAPANDRDVQVTVGRIVFPGERDFIPQDRNWLQVQVRITNVGNRTITISGVKEKLTDGTVVASAQSPDELVKPPSFAKSSLTTIGVGTAGMLAGAFIFPPLAIAASSAAVLAPMFQADRMQKTITDAQKQGLRAEAIAPGTSAAGYVFLPAVRGQAGLIVFYQADGTTKSIEVHRTSS